MPPLFFILPELGYIVEGPETAVVPLGSIANFSCTVVGYVFWEVNGAQVTVQPRVDEFAASKIYVPLSTLNHSVVTSTATESNNGSSLTCLVEGMPGDIRVLNQSAVVQLIAYGE